MRQGRQVNVGKRLGALLAAVAIATCMPTSLALAEEGLAVGSDEATPSVEDEVGADTTYVEEGDLVAADAGDDESDVSISFEPQKPYSFICGTGDKWDWVDEQTGESSDRTWNYYDMESLLTAGDLLTISDANGTRTYAYVEPAPDSHRGPFVNVADSDDVIPYYDVVIHNNQSQANEWGVGTHYYTLWYGEASCDVPVEIIENDVAAISLEPATPYVMTEGVDSEVVELPYYDEGNCFAYAYECPSFGDGDRLKVTKTNGDELTYVYNAAIGAFVNENDSGDAIDAGEVVLDNAPRGVPAYWGEGVHTCEVWYHGLKSQVEVTVVKGDEQTLTASDVTVAMGKTAIVKPSAPSGSYAFISLDPQVAKVDAQGKVTPKSVGSTDIVVIAAAGKGYGEAMSSVKVTVTQGAATITSSNKAVQVKKSISLGAKRTGNGKLTYKSSNAKIATVDKNGKIKGLKVGTAKITITCAPTKNWKKATKVVTVTVKSASAMTAKAKATKVTVSYGKVKSKAQVLKSNVKVAKKAGKLRYSNASSAAAAKKFAVNASTGKVTIPKGTKRGTYTLMVGVADAGSSKVMGASKTVTYKVVVK